VETDNAEDAVAKKPLHAINGVVFPHRPRVAGHTEVILIVGMPRNLPRCQAGPAKNGWAIFIIFMPAELAPAHHRLGIPYRRAPWWVGVAGARAAGSC